jgi:hypothetical protein
MLIDRKPSKLLPIAIKVGKYGFYVLLLSALIAQATSNVMVTNAIKEQSTRDIIVELGAGREFMVGKQVTQDHNREQFLMEFWQSISWTKQTSEEYKKTCEDITREMKNNKLFQQCQSGVDVGAQTQWGKASSQIYSYQNAIAPESRNDLMLYIFGFKPKGYDNNSSQDFRSFKVTKFGKVETFTQGKNGPEQKTPVEVEVSEGTKGVITKTDIFRYWVYTRPIERPSKNGAKTPYSEAVESSQRRGLYITRILPYER